MTFLVLNPRSLQAELLSTMLVFELATCPYNSRDSSAMQLKAVQAGLLVAADLEAVL